MSLRKKFRVLVVDRDKSTRQGLVDYYNGELKRRYAPCARSMVYKARDIADVQRKVGVGIGGCFFSLNLVVFSQNFPAAEIAELREWLSSLRVGPTFITVPSKSRSCFM